MARGELVDDRIVLDCLFERIAQADARGGFILDGFPRTLGQAEVFDGELRRAQDSLDAVIALKVDETRLADRIVNRAREAAARGESVRADDTIEALKVRLDAYGRQTAPLVAYYREAGLLRSVDGLMPIDRVSEALIAALGAGRQTYPSHTMTPGG